MVDGPIQIDVDPQKRFAKYLKDVISSVDDLSFSMGEAVRIVKKESTANFILKGTGKYAPLNQIYLNRKRVLAPGAPILTGAKPGSVIGGILISGGGISGKLRDSILKTTPDSVIRIGKKSADVGTKAKSASGAPYPGFIQDGRRRSGPDIPSRPMLFLTEKMVTRIINTIDAEIAADWKNPK